MLRLELNGPRISLLDQEHPNVLTGTGLGLLDWAELRRGQGHGRKHLAYYLCTSA